MSQQSFSTRGDVMEYPSSKRKWAVITYLTPIILTYLYNIGLNGWLLIQNQFDIEVLIDRYRDMNPFGLTMVNPIGSIAILSTLGMLTWIGLLVAIILTMQSEKRTNVDHDRRSGSGAQSVTPDELKKWNWSAAFLPVIWGLYHRAYWSLLMLIPFVKWIWWIVMGLKGNQWAWANQSWKSVEEYQRQQQKWKTWGIVAAVFSIIKLIGMVLFVIGYVLFSFAWSN